MNLAKVFAYEESLFRVLGTPEDPRFIAADVCRALGIRNASDAMSNHPPEEKGIALSDTPSGKQEMLYVTEAGLYRLIFRSDKPEAERFRRWVFHEVLPQIRRTGGYGVDYDELTELRTMYEQAKGPRVQFAIYTDIQRIMRKASQGEAAPLPEGFLNLEKLWADVLRLVAGGTMGDFIRVTEMRPVSNPNAGWYDLWMHPAPWLAALRELDFLGYGKLTQRELQSFLTGSPDWKGGCNVRLKRGVVWCWWFRVMNTANADLLQVCQQVQQVHVALS